MLDDQEVVLQLFTGIVVWLVLLLIVFFYLFILKPKCGTKNNHKMLNQ